MKTLYFILVGLILFTSIVQAQNNTSTSPCSKDVILTRHLEINPNAMLEFEDNEEFTKVYVKNMGEERAQKNEKRGTSDYIIPVVLHVFHLGNDAKVDYQQAQSGIDIINRDFNGLNDDWNTIDPEFDSIKEILNIQFCLATIDPNGNPTSGINYYEDSLAMYNETDLFIYAWDNYKYLNIYLPKYTSGEPSLFTAYAYFPSTYNSNNNIDGIFYSSIRWGYGYHSELTPGQEWASVGTHETGHWLNLYHTFEGGCDYPGDYIDDTPPTVGGAIELLGCDNNDLSCGVSTNGENYMDYNHDCKKMFTQDQVDRMIAALHLPSRKTLWSESNLIATGCSSSSNTKLKASNHNSVVVYPNPASGYVTIKTNDVERHVFTVTDLNGKVYFQKEITTGYLKLQTIHLPEGIYFYRLHDIEGNYVQKGKLMILR